MPSAKAPSPIETLAPDGVPSGAGVSIHVLFFRQSVLPQHCVYLLHGRVVHTLQGTDFPGAEAAQPTERRQLKRLDRPAGGGASLSSSTPMGAMSAGALGGKVLSKAFTAASSISKSGDSR